MTLLGSSAWAAVVIQDDFANAATYPTASINDFGWHTFGNFNDNTLPGTAPDNYLRATDATLDRAGVFKAFDFKPDNTLGHGSSLVLSMTFVGSANMGNIADNFRLFLGTRGGSPDIDANSGSQMTAGAGREGYLFRMATGGRTDGGSITADPSDQIFGSLLGGPTTGFNSLYTGNGLPDAVTYSVPKTLTLRFLRLDETTMRITGSYDFFTDTFYEFSTVDITTDKFTFDTIGFGLNSWGTSGIRTLRVSDITLDYMPIPEPSTLLLALFGLLLLRRLHVGQRLA